MIEGEVVDREARVRLTVQGARGQASEIEAVVDTGFTEFLTLPPSSIAALSLAWRSRDRAILADGSECFVDVYEAEAIWDGKKQRILVAEADADPLVGMALLSSYELKIEVRERGKVVIKRLS